MSNRAAPLRRTIRPRIESLEQRALLSDLSISLTTDQPTYLPGQPIQFTFTETNNTNRPVNTSDGPSVDGFLVSENGSLVWQSNAGINPLFIRLVTLQPGQSLTLKSTWNGVPNQGSSSILAGGTFTVTNQSDPNGASATFQITSSPPDTIDSPPSPSPPTQGPSPSPSPSPSPAGPLPPALPVTATLQTAQSTFKIGHRVGLTLTLTNVSMQPIALSQLLLTGTFQLSRGSTVIWHSARPKLATRAQQALAPGQSVDLKGTWTGKPLHRGAKVLTPGVYQLQGSAGGYTASATIRLIAPSAR